MENLFCTKERLLEAERQGMLSYRSFKSPNVSHDMIVALKGWAYKTSRAMKLSVPSYYATFNIIDSCVSRLSNLELNDLRLVACAASLLSTKYHEQYAPEVSDYVFITGNMYVESQIIDMEARIFIALGCNANVPIEINYIRTMNTIIGEDSTTYNTIKEITILLCIYGMQFLPSVVVTAVSKVISPKYGQYRNVFDVNEEVIDTCILDIIRTCKEAIKSSNPGIVRLCNTNKEVLSYIISTKAPFVSKEVVSEMYLKNYYYVDNITLKLIDSDIVDEPNAKVLGEGTYGIVTQINYNKISYAVKTITNIDPGNGVSSSFIRELSSTLTLNHNNIIKPRFITLDLSSMFIDLGMSDLRKWREKTNVVSTDIQVTLAEQMFSALKYIHENGCLHRDIKSQNILVYNTDTAPRFVLADFGLARGCHISLKDNSFTHEVVSLWYRPPELLLGSITYGPGIDVWSLGCVLYEVATGTDLFPGDSEIDQIMKIFRIMGTPSDSTWPGVEALSHYSPEFPKWKPQARLVKDNRRISSLYKTIIPLCLTMNPGVRPTSPDIYNDIVVPYVRRHK